MGAMTGSRRARQGVLLLAFLALLVAVPAEPSSARSADRSPGRSSAALSAIWLIGSAPGGAIEPRVPRGGDVRLRISPSDGVGGAPSPRWGTQPWVRALAGVLERAGHPERLGQILLRGPPRLPA